MRSVLIGWRDILRGVFWFAIVGIPLAFVVGYREAIFFAILPVGWVGMDMVHRLSDAASKSFSFCLPGFRESLRKRYFIAAAVMGLAVGLYRLTTGLSLHYRYPTVADGDLVEMCLETIGGFLVGTAGGLILGTLRLVLSRFAWTIMMLLSVPLLLVGVVAFPVLMEYPVVGIPVCTGVCVYVWGRLGDMRQVKRGHRAIVEDALEQWAQVGVTKTAAPWVESLFRRWMERREYLDTGRCIRGSLYRTFGLVFSYWKWVLASVVAGALVLGYASGLMAKVVFVGLGVVVQGIYLPIAFDDMLLPAGRRERCYATIATAAVVCLLLLATAGAVTFLSWLFSPLMPDLFGGQDGGLHYAPINGGDISLSCLLVPWFFAVRLFAYRFAFAETIAGWGFVTAIILLIFFGSKEWLERIDAVLIAGAFICGWVFFLLAAWHVRVRGPLAELPLAGGSDA